jgi:plasmid stabilization system protein ParE
LDWTIEFARDTETDFRLIFRHLVESYRAFGEPAAEAADHAARRIAAMRDAAQALRRGPLRGTLAADIAPGLRHVTIDRAVFWFDADEARRVVTIRAVFFGGQDHRRHMLRRLLAGGG